MNPTAAPAQPCAHHWIPSEDGTQLWCRRCCFLSIGHPPQSTLNTILDHQMRENRRLRQALVTVKAIVQDLPLPSVHNVIQHALSSAPMPNWAALSFERLATEFYRTTGMLAPGKDVPAAQGGYNEPERLKAWHDFCLARATALTDEYEAFRDE